MYLSKLRSMSSLGSESGSVLTSAIKSSYVNWKTFANVCVLMLGKG
jgi:hypothetical protein